jgi:TRAP transporter 4TM/12TM fusion protein
VLKSGWYFFLPIAIIVWLLVQGYSPSLAGFWAIVSAFATSLLRKEHRMSPREIVDTLAEGATSSLVMATTAGAVGIIIAAIALPGLGMKFSTIILDLAGGKLVIALFLVMLASFFLGMGMNVTSAYLLLVTLSAPALAGMGIPLISAHFFVFWTSQLAVITPPVCLSAYVAAAIAQSDPWQTGWYSLRMGLAIYYVPFMFVFFPSLLGVGTPTLILWTFSTALIGVLSFAAVTQGFLLIKTTIYERIMLGIAAITLILRGISTDLIGFGFILAVVVLQMLRQKKVH